MLEQGPVGKSNPEWCVRINPVIEEELCQADLEVLLAAKYLPSSICLPKVNHVDHLQWVSKRHYVVRNIINYNISYNSSNSYVHKVYTGS